MRCAATVKSDENSVRGSYNIVVPRAFAVSLANVVCNRTVCFYLAADRRYWLSAGGALPSTGKTIAIAIYRIVVDVCWGEGARYAAALGGHPNQCADLLSCVGGGSDLLYLC